ncbi:hypothetical protein B9Z19DRAFT_1134885 [Tuber borchii]|uniref:Uncharacterized protein n=1 Tax=Tuber borchii TaxID=42251 RepID=A0A2T6ZDU2_TUBBO|nr:hypothetical protein B9Z19DRAFT_1134885 [Tuber borchii]
MSIEYFTLELVEEMAAAFLGMTIIGTGGTEEPQQAPGAASDLMSTLERLSPPESPPPLDSIKVDEALECKICFGNEINVRFKECTHGACSACTLGIWRSKAERHNPLPSWFPCHLCRAEINRLGALIPVSGDENGDAGSASLGSGEEVIMSSVIFRVSEWVDIGEWVKGLSKEWSDYVRKANEELGNTQEGLEGTDVV